MSNLRLITTENAARFPNNNLVIDLGLDDLAGHSAFGIYAVSDFADTAIFTYIQPDVVTDDVIVFGSVGAVTAASGGDDVINLHDPQFRDGTTILEVTGGPGNDRISGENLVGPGPTPAFPLIALAMGGSGNDSVHGTIWNDSIYGDLFDDGSFSPAGVLSLDVPAAQEGDDTLLGDDGDDILSGNGGDDLLYGQDGADDLAGGAGNDFLYGGPRTPGSLDISTGGDGADAFLLSYNDDAGNSDGGASFWSEYVGTFLDDNALDEAQTIVENAGKAVLKDAFDSLASGLLLSGIGDGLGALLQVLLDLLFEPERPPSKEDVLVVTDFNPSEDVLILPLNTRQGETLGGDAWKFDESADRDEAGWGIRYESGTSSTVFAEIFLDPEYLNALGIPNDENENTKKLIELVISTAAITIDSDGIAPKNVSALSRLSASGELTATADGDTSVQIVGAFGPMTIVDAGGNNTFAGTVYGDILIGSTSANLPEDWQTEDSGKTAAFIRGFAGDDIIQGTGFPDTLSGDDGDDQIYGFFPTDPDALVTRDSLSGGDGDDLIVTGMSKADVDGGDGNDTISFQLNFTGAHGSTPFPVVLDLGTGEGTDGTGTKVGEYTVTAVENIIGSGNGDTLTGDDNDNVIDGNGGKDTLDGGGGADTVTFQSRAGPVSVDMTTGIATGPGVETIFRNFEDVIGTAAADTIVGDANDNIIEGNGGADVLDGGGGIDMVSFVNAAGGGSPTGDLTIDLRNQTVSGPASDGTTIRNFESALGLFEGGTTFYGYPVAGVKSELIGAQVPVDDDVFYPSAAAEHMVSRALAALVSYAGSPEGVRVDLVVGGPQSGGWAEGDVIAIPSYGSLEVEGSSFADTLIGTGFVNLTGGPGDDIFGIGIGTSFVTDFDPAEDRIDVSSQGLVSYSQLRIGKGQAGIQSVTAGASTIEFTDTIVTELPPEAFIFATPPAGTSLIEGTPGAAQTLSGSDGNDVIGGYGGDKTIRGRSGDDEIHAGALRSLDPDDGENDVHGGSGDDTVHVNSNGANAIDGGAGADGITVHGSGSNTVAGGSGADSLAVRGDGDNLMTGGPAGDAIHLEGDGDNAIQGGAGSDFILVDGDGDNRVVGGPDGDVIVISGGGDNAVDGASGDDVLSALGGGRSTVEGGSGDDAIFTGDGDDLILGGGDDDEILSGGGADSVDGGPGNDRVLGLAGPDDLFGGRGDDTLRGNTGHDSIDGGADDDIVSGGAEDDRLAGGDGNDTVAAGPGDDIATAGHGDDYIDGSAGDDDLSGGPGDDRIRGDTVPDHHPEAAALSGDDLLAGGEGDDSLVGLAGDDTLFGGDGDDFMGVGSGNDRARGGPGDDRIRDSGGDDTLAGDRGNDTIGGRDGNDVLSGSLGDDVLVGGTGDDTLFGGPGSDILTGAQGADLLVLTAGDGVDTIRRFEQGTDLIGLRDGLAFADLVFVHEFIIARNDVLARLRGFDTAMLTPDDFIVLA